MLSLDIIPVSLALMCFDSDSECRYKTSYLFSEDAITSNILFSSFISIKSPTWKHSPLALLDTCIDADGRVLWSTVDTSPMHSLKYLTHSLLLNAFAKSTGSKPSPFFGLKSMR